MIIFNLLVDISFMRVILYHMVEYDDEERLSGLLKAVSDSTRRALLTQLSQEGPCRVTDLANYYDMSLNAISKHLKVLESVGLITRKRIGRIHWIEANLKQISFVENWFAEIKSIWELRLDKLDEILKNGDSTND